MIDKSLKNGVVDVKRQGDRIILVKLVVGDLVFNVISAMMRVQRDNFGKTWIAWLEQYPPGRSFL